MLDQYQLKRISNQKMIAQIVVLREFCQVSFLDSLVSQPLANNFIFKGGTAIRLLFGGERFSEDLDFTVLNLSPDETSAVLAQATADMKDSGKISIKPLETMIGKSFRLIWEIPYFAQPILIKVDLSFREDVQIVEKSPLITPYPIISRNLVFHMGKDEILAEKIRALLHRQKGRDLFDLWFLLSIQAQISMDIIERKMNYYQEKFVRSEFLEKLQSFPKDKFVTDLGALVGKRDRENLPDLYDTVLVYLQKSFAEN